MSTSPMEADLDILLGLLRAAMCQWAAFLEIEMAIETAIGFAGNREVRDYVEWLAPEFLDRPETLTVEHLEPLFRLRDAAAEREPCREGSASD